MIESRPVFGIVVPASATIMLLAGAFMILFGVVSPAVWTIDVWPAAAVNARREIVNASTKFSWIVLSLEKEITGSDTCRKTVD